MASNSRTSGPFKEPISNDASREDVEPDRRLTPFALAMLRSGVPIKSTASVKRTLYGLPRYNGQNDHLIARFIYFPHLPREIQEQIWLASIEPRFIDILNHHGYDHRNSRDGDSCLDNIAARCTDPIPILSRVCRQSREIFLREYCLHFEHVRRRPGVDYYDSSTCERCYVNPAVDPLYIGCVEFPRALAYDPTDASWAQSTAEGVKQLHSVCKSLGNIIAENMPDPFEAAREKARKKLHIRKIAWPARCISHFYRSGIITRENWPCLEEVIFLDQSYEAIKGVPSAVVIPETEDELLSWQKKMSKIRYEKGLIDRGGVLIGNGVINTGDKWIVDLRVSVAALRSRVEESLFGIVDKRAGSLQLFGPDIRPDPKADARYSG